MKLITKEIARKLERAPRDTEDAQIVVKFFTPDAQCSWHITDGEQEGNDWRLFGLCDLGMGFPELGYVMLSDLQGIRGRYGLPVERDQYFGNPRLSEIH